MKKLLFIVTLLAFVAIPAFGQEKPAKKSATEADKIASFDSNGKIERGAAFTGAEVVSLADVIKDPASFAKKTVRVDGFIVRSCKKEGCWAELGAAKDSKTTVRVSMKDHQFFIPLKSAGFKAAAEGYFEVTTLSKEKVKHLIEDDGATFENINEDGTVTEIAFVAFGIVLEKTATEAK